MLRKRFYEQVGIAEGAEGYGLTLDGRPVRTPARRLLAAPAPAYCRGIGGGMAGTSATFIDPAKMPLTRLANSIIDGVSEAPVPVAAEIEKYLGTDLVFYRAESPEGWRRRNRLPGIRCSIGHAIRWARASSAAQG